jgi:uncharacterized SAM-binding protein YcdF (DUF218 family)
MTRRSHRSRFPKFFFLIFLLWLAGFFWFLAQIPSTSPPQDNKADAIVVLTGGSKRLEHGFHLLKMGRADKLLVSGVGQGVLLRDLLTPDTPPEKALQALPPGVSLGYKANSTATNATETHRWMEKNGYRSMLLVTANYHMPRALLEFSWLMPEMTILPEPAFPDDFKLESWWKHWRSFTLIVLEYHKFLAACCLRHSLQKLLVSGDDGEGIVPSKNDERPRIYADLRHGGFMSLGSHHAAHLPDDILSVRWIPRGSGGFLPRLSQCFGLLAELGGGGHLSILSTNSKALKPIACSLWATCPASKSSLCASQKPRQHTPEPALAW